MTKSWADDGLTDRKNVALAHPYCEGKSCSKFVQIPPTDLGGNRVIKR